MRQTFICSLCREGILGGALYLDEETLTYRTNKLSISRQYRNLRLPLKDITDIQKGWLLCFPTVTLTMKNHDNWKFIVFSRKRLLTACRSSLQGMCLRSEKSVPI